MKRGDSRARLESALATLLFSFALGLLAFHVWTCFSSATVDDAAITYAYAQNVALGHGYRLTPGASPAEGFSNLLQVLFLVPFAFFSVDLDAAAKGLNLGIFLLGMGVWGGQVIRHAEGAGKFSAVLLALIPLFWPSFNYWTVSGLENGMLAGLGALSILALFRAPDSYRWDLLLGLLAGALAWARPEGVLYGGALGLVRMGGGPRRFLSTGIFSLAVLALLGFRYSVFRDFVPNTYWAKIGLEHDWKEGLRYGQSFFQVRGLAYFSWLLVLPALFCRRTLGPLLGALLQAAAIFLFVVFSGGDWMRKWRFMQFLAGPAVALGGLGLCALFAEKKCFWNRIPLGLRVGLVLASGLPFALANSPLLQWEKRALDDHQSRDVDMRKIAVCASQYRALGQKLRLGRRLLESDVDVGGMSYPPGLDVLDIAGLTDRIMAHAWRRQPTLLVDYFYGERRPDTLQVHSSWLDTTPIHELWPFQDQYRVMGKGLLQDLLLGPLGAIRADHVDPAAPPVKALDRLYENVEIKGISAIAKDSQVVVFLHAYAVAKGRLPNLFFTDSGGRTWPIAWHSGFDVETGPIGSSLLGMARLPAAAFPLRLNEGWVVDKPPLLALGAASFIEVARFPLARRAGVALPACSPEAFIDAQAPLAARARGIALLGTVCGDALSSEVRESIALRLGKEAAQALDPEDRFAAIAARSALGLGPSIEQKVAMDAARLLTQPYDEILFALAQRELDEGKSGAIRRALALWLAGKEYSRVLLYSLAFSWHTDPEYADFACQAVVALGLRQDTLGWRPDCGVLPPMTLRRQGFEAKEAASLHASGAGPSWVQTMSRHRVVGGQGMRFLTTAQGFLGKSMAGEMIWGPMPWPGRFFGALIAGSADRPKVLVEFNEMGKWEELGRLERPTHGSVLFPALLTLPEKPGSQIRVRIVAQEGQGWLALDGLTFVDLP